MLPGKDGFAVAAELRAAKQFVPVLMLTARGRPEDVLKGFASGADDYLPKPFELPILLARLQGLLRRREWMRQSRPRQAAATVEYEAFSVRRQDHRLWQAGIAGQRQHHSDDSDGRGTASPSYPESGTNCLPQIHSGRSVGFARGHRHSRHRQFHRSLATLHRRQSRRAHGICSRFAASVIASSRSRRKE